MLARTGLEVEFLSDDGRDPIGDALERQGVEYQIEEYNHSTRPHWKITTDSSCGYELVSPILDNSNVRSMNAAMHAIRDGGGYVNDDCGLHVHVEVPNGYRSYEDAEAVAALYHAVYDDLVAPLLRPDRRDPNNEWAPIFEHLETFLDRVRSTRYSAVNIQCLDRQPTVEFRQMQGTLSPRLAYAWMILTTCITHEAFGDCDPGRLRRLVKYTAPSECSDELVKHGVRL